MSVFFSLSHVWRRWVLVAFFVGLAVGPWHAGAASPQATGDHLTGSPESWVIRGRVTGPDGTPVAGAHVIEGLTWGSPHAMQTTRTDEQGWYRLASRPRTTALTVVAPPFAPERKQRLRVAHNNQRVDFALKQGRTVRFRVVDKHGKPVPGAVVYPPMWRTLPLTGAKPADELGVGVPYRADQQARWIWTWAPDEPIDYHVIQGGYHSVVTGPILPSKAEHVVTLHPMLRLSGRVLDAETKRPIERYRLSLRVAFPDRKPRAVFREGNYCEHPEGRYQEFYGGTVTWVNQVCRTGPVVIVIEAPGYEAAVSRPIDEDEEKVTLDILIQREDGVRESAGINRLGIGNERVLQRRPSQ